MWFDANTFTLINLLHYHIYNNIYNVHHIIYISPDRSFLDKHMTDIAHMISGRFFGIIQDKIIELRLFEFVTTKETENPIMDL